MVPVSSLRVGGYKTSLVVEVGERVAVVSAGTESDGFRFLVRCRRCGAGVSTGTTPWQGHAHVVARRIWPQLPVQSLRAAVLNGEVDHVHKVR